MSFELKKSRNGKTVVKYTWEDFPLLCDSGPKTSSDFLAFGQKVRRGKFDAVAVDNQSNPGARLKLEGKLKGPRNAEGTLRIEGKRVPLDGGGKDRCDSGKVAWTAQKQ